MDNGYRALKNGEKIQEGDQALNPETLEWQAVDVPISIPSLVNYKDQKIAENRDLHHWFMRRPKALDKPTDLELVMDDLSFNFAPEDMMENIIERLAKWHLDRLNKDGE